MQELSELFQKRFGHAPESVVKLAGAGSSRQYIRLSSPAASVIGTVGDNVAENEAFLAFDAFFRARSLPVPEVIAVSDDKLAYLQQDLGSTSLYDIIAANGWPLPSGSLSLIERSMELLARFHACGVEGFDMELCFPRSAMDKQCVMWDLNYFKYCFLKLTGLNIDESSLEADFAHICSCVAMEKSNCFTLRDFQSRNLMVHNDELYVIDFQGSRMGSPLYDVASFLWQGRLNLPAEQIWAFAEKYVEAARREGVDIPDNWRDELKYIALFRLLQVLGAYGLRGLHERKVQFMSAISPVSQRISDLLASSTGERLPYLRTIISQLLCDSRFNPVPSSAGHLLVTIYSFSYKKGIPASYDGNGGGYVFDCRAIHNPGRYDQYKKLTGMDAPVIQFLEDDGEMLTFMDHCYALVDHSVEEYLKRGFSNLMVCFGCTGGQHRSVYGAEAMARHISEHYDVDVTLIHREQGVQRHYAK